MLNSILVPISRYKNLVKFGTKLIFLSTSIFTKGTGKKSSRILSISSTTKHEKNYWKKKWNIAVKGDLYKLHSANPFQITEKNSTSYPPPIHECTRYTQIFNSSLPTSYLTRPEKNLQSARKHYKRNFSGRIGAQISRFVSAHSKHRNQAGNPICTPYDAYARINHRASINYTCIELLKNYRFSAMEEDDCGKLVSKLIWEVSQKPILYDPQNPMYKDNQSRARAWQSIAEKMNMPGKRKSFEPFLSDYARIVVDRI